MQRTFCVKEKRMDEAQAKRRRGRRGRCACVCVKRGNREAGGWQTKVREGREENVGGGGGGGGGAKADSREGKLRRGTVE